MITRAISDRRPDPTTGGAVLVMRRPYGSAGRSQIEMTWTGLDSSLQQSPDAAADRRRAPRLPRGGPDPELPARGPAGRADPGRAVAPDPGPRGAVRHAAVRAHDPIGGAHRGRA